MRGGLTLAQHLANWNGRPTLAAKALAGVLAVTAAAAGYALGPAEDPPRDRKTVETHRLAGELPAPASMPALALRGAAPVPELQKGGRIVVRAQPEPVAAAPAPAPAPTATPEPTAIPPAATPEQTPAQPAPVVTPVPARPAPTPAESFDLSG